MYAITVIFVRQQRKRMNIMMKKQRTAADLVGWSDEKNPSNNANLSLRYLILMATDRYDSFGIPTKIRSTMAMRNEGTVFSKNCHSTNK